MTSRAKIAEQTAVDGNVLVPYAGEQRAVHELRSLNATFTAEDYALIRKALGGGKRGRERARELLPLACPSCDCRLTHFEPARRPPYFAATARAPRHGAQCELAQDVRGDVSSSAADFAQVETTLADAREAEVHTAIAAAQTDGLEPATYVIEDVSEVGSERASALRARLGLPPAAPPLHHEPARPHERALPDARALLTQALNRSVRADSQVRFRGERYRIAPAAELHRYDDGELVAVYGRAWQARWSEAAGRLTLVAAPRTVQVWATAAVPRFVLGIDAGAPIPLPVLRKPVPFIAFGKLKKLADVCGVPVVRREFLVLLQPLELAATSQRPSAHGRSLRDLTDELDELLSSPLSAHQTGGVHAEPALVQAFASSDPAPY